jgi:DNA-binding XRE family transcriptional regulator
MSTDTDFLELGSESPSERRARILAGNDSDLLSDLIALRKEKRITQAMLAGRMGVTQATVASFERYDSDPKLSTIRRYAHAIEALVNHVVEADEGQYAHGESWQVMSFSIPVFPSVHRSTGSYAVGAPSRSAYAVAA